MTIATLKAGAPPLSGVEATCLRLDAKAPDAESVAPGIERRRLARERPEDALVEFRAAAVNPSDV